MRALSNMSRALAVLVAQVEVIVYSALIGLMLVGWIPPFSSLDKWSSIVLLSGAAGALDCGIRLWWMSQTTGPDAELQDHVQLLRLKGDALATALTAVGNGTGRADSAAARELIAQWEAASRGEAESEPESAELHIG
jgi:hypothetical protein